MSLKTYIAFVHDYHTKYGLSSLPDSHIEINLLFHSYLKGEIKSPPHAKVATKIISKIRNGKEFPSHIKAAFLSDEFVWRESKTIVDGYKIWMMESKSSGNWIGSIGDKIEISVETILVRRFKNSFDDSDSFFVKFQDQNKNILTAFLKKEIKLGDIYKISAKIKNHDLFENEKQTQIFYVKTLS